MRHSKINGRILYGHSRAVCFAPTLLYVHTDMFLLVTPCRALSSLCGQMGTTITTLHHGGCDKALTQRLPAEIRFIQCVICRPGFLCYFSSEGRKEVIAFLLSSQWETLIWSFFPTCPVQILAFVPSNVISSDCRCLLAVDCTLNRYVPANWNVIVLSQGECTGRRWLEGV